MGFRGEVEYLMNFADFFEKPTIDTARSPSFLYSGRLSAEKGIPLLLEAFRNIPAVLRIAGTGPEEEAVQGIVVRHGLKNVQLLGHLNEDRLREEIRRASVLVLPSLCYENNPRSVLEAFAMGKPAIVSNIGGQSEIVQEGSTGFRFAAGDPADLRRCVVQALENPHHLARMGEAAFEWILREGTAEKHYARMMDIFEVAQRRWAGHAPSSRPTAKPCAGSLA